ncbi:MAG: diguanylate cyclase response regulator [Phycisphaerae bacterium]|nr:diguanylate cyclase response regulator [Phycisphaerae bacterium]
MGVSKNQLDCGEPTVLVIDDSIDVHRLLLARLRSETLKLVCVASGPAGLKAVDELGPSVILLDLDMPLMDGFEVLRELKDDPSKRDIPVIVLSGLNSPQDKVTAFDLGAHDYVTKPFDVAELRVRVRAALRLSRLLAMLGQRAQVDGLTGLWNRGYFDSRWAEEVSTASRHDRPLSLAMLDIDHFKAINDTFGHPAGDAVLEGFSEMLGQQRRASDIACRYGGEEVALIMPDTTPADALVLANRVRAKLEETVWKRHPERRVTVSIGIAGADHGVELGAADWLQQADEQLYKAKQNGRNRTEVKDLGNKLRLAEAG